MSIISDSRDKVGPGIWPAQHQDFHLDSGPDGVWRLHTRPSWLACRILRHRTAADLAEDPGYEIDQESVGDLTGAVLWRKEWPTHTPEAPTQERLIPGWRMGPWPVTPCGPLQILDPSRWGPMPAPAGQIKGEGASTVAGHLSGDPCAILGPGVPGFRPVLYQPTKPALWIADRRFYCEPLTLPATSDGKFWLHPIPVVGQYGLAIDSSAEQFQHAQWHRTDPRICAPAASGESWLPQFQQTGSFPAMMDLRTSDLVCDMETFFDLQAGQTSLRISQKRHALISSFWRVVLEPESSVGVIGAVPPPGMRSVIGQANNLAWSWSHTCAPAGGLVYDRVLSPIEPEGYSNPIMVPPPPAGDVAHAIGVMSFFGGGRFTTGGWFDWHRIGKDADGHPVNPVHIEVGMPFYANEKFDGPLLFEPGIPLPNVQVFPFPTKVHLAFHTGLKRWEWFTWSPQNASLSEPYVVPVLPCGYDPRDRAYVWSFLDHAYNAIMMRPIMLVDGLLDPRRAIQGFRDEDGGQDAFADFVRRSDSTAPMTIRIEAFGARSGTDWTYTIRPREGRYKGGTASGGIAIMPPEIDIVDIIRGDLKPAGIPTSHVHIVAIPDQVFWASGVPDPRTGELARGYRWGWSDERKELAFQRRDTVRGLNMSVLAMDEDGVLFLADSARAPIDTPVGGGYLFSEGGALKWKGSRGTVTTIAPA